MLLARAGHRVLLVDRATFPSDTLSTHYIHQPGVAALDRWGLLEQVAATGAPPIRRYRFDLGPFALEGAPPPLGHVDAAYSVRRGVLDEILLDGAAGAGRRGAHGLRGRRDPARARPRRRHRRAHPRRRAGARRGPGS